MKKMKFIHKILSLALLVVFAYSCKKEVAPLPPEPEPSGETFILRDEAKVIDLDTRAIISAIDTSNFTFTINGETDLSKNLKVGDVIVDSVSEKAPYGYLRKIKSIDSKKGNLVLETEQASLPEVLSKANISFNSGQLKHSQLEKVVLAPGVQMKSPKNADFTVFELDFNETFTNDQGEFNIHGHSELSISVFFDYDYNFHLFALPPHLEVTKFETGIQLDQASSISMVCEEGASFEEDYLLATFSFTPWTFMAGPIPIVLVPRINLVLEADGTISAEYTASASESFTGRLGVKYSDDDGWNTIEDSDPQHDFVAPNIDLDANANADIGPRVSLLLYGMAGPFVYVSAYADITSHLYTTTGNWDLTFTLGLRGQIGVEVDVIGFSADKNYPFSIFVDTLMHLDNEPFGNALYLEYPVNNESYPIGDNINITTDYVGTIPDEVVFNIDGIDVYSDNTYPFEFSWATSSLDPGEHTIEIRGIINGIAKTQDNATISLYVVYWSTLDLSSLGLSDATTCTDVVFRDGTTGWMTVASPGNGKILQTNDGGSTWTEKSNTSFPMSEFEMLTDTKGIYLDYFHNVKYSSDAGATLEQLNYNEIGVTQPTFQDKDIFDIDISTENEEIIAIGKDTGIPYHFLICRANISDHFPINDFEIPFPNEYGMPPKIEMKLNRGLVYGVIDEDNPSTAYYMISNDGGVNWTSSQFYSITNSNTYLRDADFITEDKGWIVGSENGNAIVLLTTDGCQTWEKVTIPGAASFGSVDFTGPEEGYASVFDYGTNSISRLYRTQDGGYTWDEVTEVTSTSPMNKVFFLNSNMGFVVGKGSDIHRYHL